MKINQLLVLSIWILTLSSCQKESTLTQDDHKADVTYYNAENTTAVPWEELPELMRNAEFTSSTQPKITDLEDGNRSDCVNFAGLTPALGGSGNTHFFMFPESSCDRIYGMVIKAGSFVDAIFIVYQREDGTTYIPSYAGGNGGVWYGYLFEDDERITHLAYKHSNVINQINIQTIYSHGVHEFHHGGNGGTFRSFYAGSNRQILGLYGESGLYLNKLGGVLYTENF